jgi:hypothetical protein
MGNSLDAVVWYGFILGEEDDHENELLDGYFLNKAEPINTGRYGVSDDMSLYAYIRESIQGNWIPCFDLDVQKLNPDPMWNEMLKEFAKKHGLKIEKIGWFVSASWW